MSHEIVLLTGEADDYSRQRRTRVVAHAAAAVPGVVSWEMVQTPHATLALVTTAPIGGSAAVVDTHATGTTVVLGLSAAANAAALDGTASYDYGAELGHVKVIMRSTGAVELATDGTGIIPSFWSVANRELRFSTHLASLVSLGAKPRLDESGAIEYLIMLQPLGERTILHAASLLPAGGRIEIRPGRAPVLSVQRLYAPSNDALDDDQAVGLFADEWACLTRELFERSGAERVALGLSGGLDSRAIGHECVAQGHHPHAFTYGSADTTPARVATRVAQILQLDHTLLPVRDDRLMSDPVGMASLLDGAHSPAEMYEFWFASALRGFCDVVINGHGGGPLWGDEKALGLGDSPTLLAALTRRFQPEVAALVPFLANLDARAVEHLLRESIQTSLHEWEVDSRPDRVSFWNVHNRQFRWGNMLATALRRSGLRLEAPFMDSRFLRLSARLTADQRMNGRLYLRVHREVFARTAGVPRSDDGNPPRSLNHLFWSADRPYARQFADLATRHPVSAGRRAWGRLQSVAAHRLSQHSASSHLADQYSRRHAVFAADTWLRDSAEYRQTLASFLARQRPPALVSQAAVDQAVDGLYSAERRTGALRLARIATLGAWNQEFVRRGHAYHSVQ